MMMMMMMFLLGSSFEEDFRSSSSPAGFSRAASSATIARLCAVIPGANKRRVPRSRLWSMQGFYIRIIGMVVGRHLPCGYLDPWGTKALLLLGVLPHGEHSVSESERETGLTQPHTNSAPDEGIQLGVRSCNSEYHSTTVSQARFRGLW